MRIVKLLANCPSHALALLLLLNSCSQDAIDFNDGDALNVENESASDAYFADSEDITSVTVSSDAATGGRIIYPADPRLQCALVTIDVISINPANPRGLLTIDFGAGCIDDVGNQRKGIITIAYHGRRFLPGSGVVVTLSGYEINGVKLEGVRTITNTTNSSLSKPVFDIAMSGGKITWPDGTFASRDESTRRELIPGATEADRQWHVTGSATGMNRRGITYSAKTTAPLVYKRSCALNNQVYLAVAGTKDLVVGDKKITIDYGDGTCDKLATVSIRSKSKVVELSGTN